MTGWTPGGVGAGTVSHDGVVGGVAPGSAQIRVNTGRNRAAWTGQIEQVDLVTTINAERHRQPELLLAEVRGGRERRGERISTLRS